MDNQSLVLWPGFLLKFPKNSFYFLGFHLSIDFTVDRYDRSNGATSHTSYEIE